MAFENHVLGLFPTPFMQVEKLLPSVLVDGILARFSASAVVRNSQSPWLSHTAIGSLQADDLILAASALILPRLADFGELLFGERLVWSIKDIWLNVLQTGGHQAMHNHANCFVSGVLYLTGSHPSARTVFIKGSGGRDFVFSNAHLDTTQGPFNADKWIAPAPAPGDLILFPSYLLHEVPLNQGDVRVSLAFNAVPQRLDSWGYAVGFQHTKGAA